MAGCRRHRTTMSYRSDYRQRRLLTGHFITVTGGEDGEKRGRTRERGLKTEREVRKTQLEESAWKKQQCLVVAG